ncbi:MAG TPA: lipoprotein-releasing system ATP-binding protein LolD [Bacteroidales bacterium]|nr:MAG: lipoprotein ABC transporter ATP-binding protein [Bacteroidetes bacterium GWE2_42_24]OFY32071.1 MAG: lipoprotein ABC transporter ATP-binding protein [Bacteroidetes bacterium GWF2_43_11]PKP27291.1 MAG: lipoprotein-releasing system ATP-binding protein LolD [Bacteroidetes bacterium HGW-Bacteroidetes-22]HBZ66337.1 lipoprotein-releasing system ATP-binding protein LolD [Bacteroidales bacterium]
MLEVNDVSRRFGELTVLRSVSLAVSKGEVVTITGPSGAGKSTLLHILGTLDRPSEGEVRVGGELVTQLNDARLSAFRNRHIGFVFQFHHLLPEFTSVENVSIPAFIAGESREKAQQRAVELLEKLGLGQRLHHKPSELSGGEQQRVAVARALINNPDVVLADEPSGNLDTNAANQLHQLFFDLRSSMQQTFVIVTHNPELAAQADRTIHLTDGRVVE